MTNIRSIIRKGLLGIIVSILAFGLPLETLANVSADSATTCKAPSYSTPGIHVPTGSDATAFTYQCPDPHNPNNQYVGDWLSAHYVFYPETATYQPLVPTIYTYDKTTGLYDYSTWIYAPTISAYELTDNSTDTPPAGADVVGGPETVTAPTEGTGTNDGATGDDSNNGTTPSTDTDTPDNTGDSSNGGSNTTSTTATDNTGINDANNVGVNNTLGSTATSGNAIVVGNTTGGDATSGLTQDEANIVNMLQSSTNAVGAGSTVVTFTDNVDGNVDGNLLLDPSTLANVQPESVNSTTTTANNNLTVNNSNGEAINNNLNLSADSGNATVSGNTDGGNATSGSAEIEADLVNMIHSAVTAGHSFVGVININGNLNGNILVPQNFVNQLLADNVPTVDVTAPNSTSTTSTNVANTTNISNTNDQGITNKVNSTASTGDATVSDNTSSGNATSGQATTNLTAFNLTGSSVIGSNDLLVFVNVLGSWVGMIVGAPAGTTAAEIGGGINSDTTNVANNSTLNNTNNEQINNNINAATKSGNATVKDNTTGGSATTGNADTAVNTLNLEDDSLSLTNWFGILFINVFGSWTGNFGDSPTVSTDTPAEAASILSHSPVYGKYVTTSASPTDSGTGTTTSSAPASTTGNTDGTVLAAKTVKDTTASTTPATKLQSHSTAWKSFVAIGGAVFLYIVGDAFYSHRKRLKNSTNS